MEEQLQMQLSHKNTLVLLSRTWAPLEGDFCTAASKQLSVSLGGESNIYI